MTITADEFTEAFHEITAGMSPEQQAEVAAKVHKHQVRTSSLARLNGPLGLLLELNPSWSWSPALQLISDEMEHAIRNPGTWLCVSLPPQEGKSRLSRHAVVRALQHNPECRIAVASYQERLARKTGEAVRNIIRARGSGTKDTDVLGIQVGYGDAAAGDWSLDGHEGGVLSVGVGSGITGRSVDLLVVDDPLKGRQQADSETIREALHQWWDNDAETRLGPESSVIIIQTRWHEDDLIGRLTAEHEAEDPDGLLEILGSDRDIRMVNIPARADGQTLDSLAGVPEGRDDEGWLVSVRGDRVPKWRRIASTRLRVWAALYQGRPAPLEGGIFQKSWIDQHRVDRAPELERIEIAVDPADTGQGDAAGILVLGRTADRHGYVLADLSGQLSRGQWARRVSLAAVRWNADMILAEQNLGMRDAVKEAWSVVRRQAAALAAAPNGQRDRVAGALAALAAAGDDVAADETGLREVLPLMDGVFQRPTVAPCRVEFVTPKGKKRTRAEAVTVYYETGTCHHVGQLAQLEHEMATWQPGQPSPNRLDTLAHGLASLLSGAPQAVKVHRSGTRVPTRTGGSRSAR